jgi:tRNA (mo5U34)-methyltransferase
MGATLDEHELAELRQQVEAGQWYHTFEFAPGITTPGWFDLRGIVGRVPIPDSLSGSRCLDIGTFDGFWAFEMERRGGEVMAVDVIDPFQWDWPAGSEESTLQALDARKRGGSGFEIAARVFNSNVERRELSVYDLDPAEVGEFDFIYLGSLLLHLRDPVKGLARVREVCSGTLLVCDAISPLYSLITEPMASLEAQGRPWWWRPNIRGLERIIEAAGFERVGATKRVWMTPGQGRPAPPVTLAGLRTRIGRRELFESRFGDPHAIVVARP